MGAEVFSTVAVGDTAQIAFNAARAEAQWEHGHGGYTGSIAEKSRFVMITLPAGKDAHEYAAELIDAQDPRVDNKWGPAGCIHLGGKSWLFFGWASS